MMDINEIKNIIQTAQYDFLRNSKELKNHIILLTLGGSVAYGTDIPGKSDLDIRGIYLNSKQQILTMNCTHKPFEDKITDTVIYPLKQIINLLTACNPNTIEMLGTKKEHLLICEPEAELILKNSNLFLSKRVSLTFNSYAFQQLKRLQNALTRDYKQTDKEKHILGTITNQLYSLQENYAKFSNNNLNLYLDNSNKDNIEKEIFFDVNFKHYPLRDFRNIYCDMDNALRMYEKLGQRNSKKDELHLNKHAMHLIRLFGFGIEILTTGKINTYRENDKDFLLDIRNGKYSYDEIFAMVDKYTIDFEYAKNNTILPDSPDLKAIEELVITINERLLQK